MKKSRHFRRDFFCGIMVFMDLIAFSEIAEDVKIAFGLLGFYWWAYVPVLLAAGFFLGRDLYLKARYRDSLPWTLLEIKPPPAVDRSPKAVEQIFAGLSGIYNGPVSWKDKFFHGKIPDWFSLEIVGLGGETKFFVRTLSYYRNIVESNIFAQYPNAEIKEAEDYMKNWPSYLPNEEIDFFGTDLVLNKDAVYPIQTYQYFEEKTPGLEQIKRIDPLASVSEVFSTFQSGEDFVIQILIRPTDDSWTQKGAEVIEGIMGREKKKSADPINEFFEAANKLTFGVKPKEEEKKKEERKMTTAVEEEIVKAIGRKISKIGFETGIRLVYVAKKKIFQRYRFSAVIGAFKQLATLNLNGFKIDKNILTHFKGYLAFFFPSDRGFLADRIILERKWRLYRNLRERIFPRQFFILNTEELATIFHLPGVEVKAPMFPRVEAKKGQPPPGLAVE